MIKFADFLPKVTEKGGIFKAEKRQLLAEPIKRANEWIDRDNIDVVNIETVVLPNIHNPGEKVTSICPLFTI